MSANPLVGVQRLGQSIWLDHLSRRLITSGELQRLIERDGLRGVTSNPKIFADAITGSTDYDADIRELAQAGASPSAVYEALALADIQAAADILRPVYDELDGRDGYVSLEVNPHLAHDTAGTVEEARRLWKTVNRPNLFIKIPATRAGVPAIEQCLVEGININVTLLFSLDRYREIAETYVYALQRRHDAGYSVALVESVASFFLSRVDVLVDKQLEEIAAKGGATAARARSLMGKAAIASAKLAYQIYKDVFGDADFQALAVVGTRTQRVLWASTGTKNPDYSDIKYVEPLIGPDTVNTLPLETLEAYRDHGKPASRLEEDLDDARETLSALAQIGIDMSAVAEQLEAEGIEKFAKPFDALLTSIEQKSRHLRTA